MPCGRYSLLLCEDWRIAFETTKITPTVHLSTGYLQDANSGGEILQCYGNSFFFLVQIVRELLFVGGF